MANPSFSRQKRDALMRYVSNRGWPSRKSIGLERDEYPYASTEEGGMKGSGALLRLPSLMYVPENQNSMHGIDLQRFYREKMRGESGQFKVVLKPSKTYRTQKVPVPIVVPKLRSKPIEIPIREPIRLPMLPYILNPMYWCPECFSNEPILTRNGRY